jgi:hypothetical protein
LLIPDKDVLYINTGNTKKVESEIEHSALLEIYPFDPSKYSPLFGELEKGISELLVLVRGSVFNIPEIEVKCYAQLIHKATGKEVPTGISFENKTGAFSMKIPTGDLLPGRYSLYLFAEKPNTQVKATVHTTFTVK